MLQNGSDWLAGQLKDHAGRSVVYKRADTSSDTLTATVAQQMRDIETADGFTTQAEFFEWVFTTADLVIDGSAITPRRGDLIEETLGGVARVYEVLPPDDEPASVWADSAGVMTRVYTKRVAT